MNTIIEGIQASEQVCLYVDTLMWTYNPSLPETNLWIRPKMHPCKSKYTSIHDFDSDYIEFVNTVERHTHCSTKYCLKHTKAKNDLQCRFKYPFDVCNKTTLVFEPVHTKQTQYKAKIITKINDTRLNSHHRIQLQGWRASCDVQVTIDHHACVEYLSKYAAKAEPRSSMLNIFNSVITNSSCKSDLKKTVKKVIMKTLGQRYISVQETMHLLLSLKLYCSSFTVLPVSLNGSRKVKSYVKGPSLPCTNGLYLRYMRNVCNMKIIFQIFKIRVS